MRNVTVIVVLLFLSTLGQAQYCAKKITKFKPTLRTKLECIKEKPFRFPLGDSVGHGYRVVQKLGNKYKNWGLHAGIDINDMESGNTDLGDIIYSINDGVVAMADPSNYLAVYYKYKGKVFKAIYYHCDTVYVKANDFVSKGQQIATVGNTFGWYSAHLHLEFLTDTSNLFIGYFPLNAKVDGVLDPEKILPYYNKTE